MGTRVLFWGKVSLGAWKMAASRVEGETYFHIDNENFNEELSKIIASILPKLKKVVKRQAYFNILFFDSNLNKLNL